MTHHAGLVILSPQEAAPLLGVSPRTVRRWIAAGTLEGTLHPVSTTRAACLDLCRRRQKERSRRPARVDKSDSNDSVGNDVNAPKGTLAPHGVTSGSDMSEAIVTLAEQVERLALQVGQLSTELAQARGEVGRLEAELAQCRREATGVRTPNAERRPGAPRGGLWGRVGLWLRR